MSSKSEIKIQFETEKLDALDIFLKEQGSSVLKALEEALQQLYEKTVPEDVRKFVDAKAGVKPRRSASSDKPRTGSKSNSKKEATERKPPDGQPGHTQSMELTM